MDGKLQALANKVAKNLKTLTISVSFIARSRKPVLMNFCKVPCQFVSLLVVSKQRYFNMIGLQDTGLQDQSPLPRRWFRDNNKKSALPAFAILIPLIKRDNL
jgi:hypothetical protein